MGIVGEGDVVGGMPVEAVAVHVEGHRVQHVVDGGDHLQGKEQTITSDKDGRQTGFQTLSSQTLRIK